MPGGAIILAAGFSRRFGSDKRQHLLANGEPLLIATLSVYVNTVDETAVLLREEDLQLASLIRQSFSSTRCPVILTTAKSHLGMGNSIASAIGQLKSWQYAMIALGDMPRVKPETIRWVEAELRKARSNQSAKIVQPFYQKDKAGHPVGFTRELFPELEALQGDYGAKPVLEKHAGVLVRINTNDAGILWDMDNKPA